MRIIGPTGITLGTIALLISLATASTGQTLHLEEKLDSPIHLNRAITCEQGKQILAFGREAAIYVWTLPSATPQKIDLPEGPVLAITCASPSTAAVWLRQGKALILDLNSNKIKSSFEPKGRLWGFSLSPDASLLAVSNNAGPVQLWDAASGQKLATGANNFGASNSATFSPNGEVFVSTDGDSYIRVYDRHGKHLYTTDGGLLEGFDTAFISDSKRFTESSADGTISLYDTASGKKIKTSATCNNPIRFLAMSPDNQQVMGLEVNDFTLKPVNIGLWDMHSDNIRPIAGDASTVIGFGTNATHLLLIKQEDPKTIALYSVR